MNIFYILLEVSPSIQALTLPLGLQKRWTCTLEGQVQDKGRSELRLESAGGSSLLVFWLRRRALLSLRTASFEL